MAYTPNALSLAYETLGGTFRHFVYVDPNAEGNSTIVGANWFSDGAVKGMRKGDLVDVVQQATPKMKQYQVASTSGDAATVAAVTAIS